MKVTLVRHPPVALVGICYGQADVLLAKDWQESAARLKKSLENPEQIYSSPAYRCRKLANYLEINPKIDDRLKELDFGSWELQPWKAIPRAELDVWTKDLDAANPYQGETCNQLKARAMDFWNELIKQGGDALVICHTGWIHSLLAQLLDTDMKHITRLKIDYCKRTEIQITGKMIHLNYVNH